MLMGGWEYSSGCNFPPWSKPVLRCVGLLECVPRKIYRRLYPYHSMRPIFMPFLTPPRSFLLLLLRLSTRVASHGKRVSPLPHPNESPSKSATENKATQNSSQGMQYSLCSEPVNQAQATKAGMMPISGGHSNQGQLCLIIIVKMMEHTRFCVHHWS